MIIVMVVVVVMDRVEVFFLFSILETQRKTNRGGFCLFCFLLFWQVLKILWIFSGASFSPFNASIPGRSNSTILG